ncbi:MAG TPA: FAD-binding oxidoreductase [Terriglobales bacterium]|nr:FAD-binding oxidoreductase [Terriglobales bacterium]
MIDRRPALIVRCADADDVVRAITFARRQGLQVSVRGGGHSTPGFAVCDGGLMIDLSQMCGIVVDPTRRTARAEPGLTLKDLIAATQVHGLATTTGVVSETGIAGLTLGGGIGWLEGRFGLACDNVLSFEIVTADGQVRRSSAIENPDLYWALRGGGGNFGVVTQFEYQLHPLGKVLAGMVIHPMARAKELLRFYRDFTASAPDELTVYAALLTSPDGHPAVAMIACYSGSLDAGERIVAPLRQFGLPLVDTIGPMDYLDVIQLLDAANPPGHHYYEKGCSVPHLTDDAIDAIVAAGAAPSSPYSLVLIQHLHGAAGRVAPDATAFALRGEYYLPLFIAHWTDGPADRHIAWSCEAWAALRPFASGGTYVNFMAADEAARVRPAYGENYKRLVEMKNIYDPTNVFRAGSGLSETDHGIMVGEPVRKRNTYDRFSLPSLRLDQFAQKRSHGNRPAEIPL